jgi:hypothetical protein
MRERCASLIAYCGIIVIIITSTFDCCARILSASFGVLAEMFRRDVLRLCSGPSGLLLHLKIEALCSFEMSVTVYQPRQRNIPEDLNLGHFSLYLIKKDPGSPQTSYRPTLLTENSFKGSLLSLPIIFLVLVVSGLRRDVNEIIVLWWFYAAEIGSLFRTLRDNLSVQSSRVKQSKKISWWTALPLLLTIR